MEIIQRAVEKIVRPYVEKYIQPEKTKRVKTVEQTVSALSNDWYQEWKQYLENPDPVLAKKDWRFYKEMARDDQIHTCETIKKVARLSTGWSIKPASDSPEDKKIADFIYFVFKNLKGTFRKKIKDIYSAFEFGFSVTEKTYGYIDSGQWKGYIGLKHLKTRDPENILFNTDKYGNIVNVVQNNSYGTEIKIDPQDVIIYSHDAKFNNPYGSADLKYVYKAYIAKKWVMRFWSIALERFGMGFTVAKYPPGDKDQKTYLLKILKNLQARTGIVVPNDVELEILSATSSKTNYEMALDRYDKAIARGILVPDLLGFSSSGTVGSYALGKKHFDIFLMVLEEIGRETEETIIDEQVIKPLVDLNFVNVKEYPQFKFYPLDEDDKFELLKVWTQLVTVGAVSVDEEDEKYIRKLTGFPEKKDEEQRGIPARITSGKAPGKISEKEKIKQSFSEFKPKILSVIDFAQIKKEWDLAEQQTIAKLHDIMKLVQSDFYKTLDKKVWDKPNLPPVEIEKLQLKHIGDFKLTVQNALVNTYLSSKYKQLQELQKIGVELPKKFAFEDIPEMKLEEALKFFKGKIPMTKKELEFYIRKAFYIAGAEKEAILNKAKIILFGYIKDGNKKKAKKLLKELFDAYIRTGELKKEKSGNYELFSGYHIETLVRTNMAEAVNEGRKAMMEDSLVQDVVVAYTVSIVLDENTTEFCQSLQGQVWNKDEFEFPPYHYNCRTIALPVMDGETYQLSEWKPSPYKGF